MTLQKSIHKNNNQKGKNSWHLLIKKKARLNYSLSNCAQEY